MALNLIKLCVGADSIADLERWIASHVARRGEQIHTTRMMPKRGDEILPDGSLYWVIRGQIACRQRILALRQRKDGDGISRCDIVLDPGVIAVDPRPRGPFQGWRYFPQTDVPADLLTHASDGVELPRELGVELRRIGLV